MIAIVVGSVDNEGVYRSWLVVADVSVGFDGRLHRLRCSRLGLASS